MTKQIFSRTSFILLLGPALLAPARTGIIGAGLLGLLLATGACGSDSTSSGTGGQGGAATVAGGSNDDGGASSGGPSTGGASVGGASVGGATSSGGASTGGATSSGGEIWGCVEAGGVCICQSGTDKEHESVCTGTYKCCISLPFAGAIRCQCQDPGTSKCEAPAGSGAKVVDKCPPP